MPFTPFSIHLVDSLQHNAQVKSTQSDHTFSHLQNIRRRVTKTTTDFLEVPSTALILYFILAVNNFLQKNNIDGSFKVTFISSSLNTKKMNILKMNSFFKKGSK